MSAIEVVMNLGGTLLAALGKTNKEMQLIGPLSSGASRAMDVFEKRAKAAAGQLDAIKADPEKYKKMISAERELAEMQKKLVGTSRELAEGAGSMRGFFTFDVVEGARTAAEAIRGVSEALIDLGKEMVTVAGRQEDLDVALKLNVGEKDAGRLRDLTGKFGKSAFSDDDLQRAMLPLLEQTGTKLQPQWGDLLTAATDVATRTTTGIGGVNQVLAAFTDIARAPEHIRGQLKTLGVDQVPFYESLGKQKGISAKAAQALAAAGKIGSDQLIHTALEQIAAREGGKLGAATNAGSHTLGASLARLANLKEDIFQELAGSDGMKKVQGFLDNFENTLKGPIGHDLVRELDQSFGALFGDLSGPNGAKKIESVIREVGAGVRSFLIAFKQDWPKIEHGFESAAHWLGGLPGILSKIITSVEVLGTAWAATKIVGGITSVSSALPSIGTRAGQIAGVVGGTGLAVGAAAASVGLAAYEIHSTAKELGGWGSVFRDFKDYVSGDGPAVSHGNPGHVPHMALGGIVTSPTLALIGEAGPEMVVPLSGGRALGGVHIQIGDVVVQGAESPAATARAVRAELQKFMDEAAIAFGAPA